MGAVLLKDTPLTIMELSSSFVEEDVIQLLTDARALYVPNQPSAPDRALNHVRTAILSPIAGHRVDAQLVVMVLTDGETSTGVDALRDALEPLRTIGANLIPVSYKSVPSDEQLSNLQLVRGNADPVMTMSDLAQTAEMTPADFQALVADIVYSPPPPTTSAPSTTTTTTTTTLSSLACPGPVLQDIVFVMDASGSLQLAGFQRVVAFVTTIISGLPIGLNSMRYGQ